uniref:Coiled-coil domain containing 125 n=1 Tax=Anolis carolinensis TaxID=28377 RepID=G1KK09_ANOCA|nr:PREDICTED: coiled-coil domain-containing protein 125 [Anolis carolinensis]|eukprot:XP_003216379.1 PREDICTED: coiled-coil domain-containing protein 125 [Anolis carolinensis]
MLPMSEAVLSQNKVGETLEDEDDMTCGDLGNGLVKRHSGLYEPEGFNVHASRPRGCSTGKSVSPLMLIKKEDSDVPVLCCSRCNSLSDMPVKKFGMNEFRTYSRQNSSESNSEASNEELKHQLQEVVEEVEILRVELEASQRQLEGKEQALKLLQSMAVLDKATSHTKAIFKKTEEQKKALEKEINVLQWEMKLNQEKFKNIEEAWAEKYDSIYCENSALKETLKLKTEEIKSLKSEKEILDQQHLEILAMLDVKQQKIVQENMSLSKSGLTEITGLEMAVLGACTCNGPEGEPCSCAKMSAATRKKLLQLNKEFEILKKSKEEAYIMADAFRIAFEQQLMRRKDQALRLAQMSKSCRKETRSLNWKHIKEDGAFRSQGIKKSLGERLKGMLISGTDSKKLEELDNPHEIIRMLIDLLNDKEEILAHQRKVSYMLARTLEKKENGSQNKAKKLSEELPLRNRQCGNDSEPQELAIPLCSCCQTYTVEDGSCSVSNTCPSRTLDCTSKNSHSTTSGKNDNLEECNTN